MKSFAYKLCETVLRPWYALVYPGRVEGLENIPDQGG